MNKERLIVPEDEIQSWKDAYIGSDVWRGDRYITQIVPTRDPLIAVYATLNLGAEKIAIEIPVRDPHSDDELRGMAYNTTIFGETDDVFRKFGVGVNMVDRLITSLNRNASAVEGDAVINWVYTHLGIEHAHRYTPVYINSERGGDRFSILIQQLRDRQRNVCFLDNVKSGLPQITVTPCSVDAYLDKIVSTLKFRPKDW